MQLPVDPLHWALALLPIVLLFVLLAAFRWKGVEAGPVGMFAAAAIALVAFRTPWHTLAVASGKGVWDALFILYVIWPSLLFYQITRRAGAFDALRQGLMRFSQNEFFLVLAFGWVFNSFLQGVAGFGTPIAIVAPLLIALGVAPLYAVAIPLIGSAWGHLFGTLAASWFTLLRVTGLTDPGPTALQAAILLCIPVFGAGAGIAWMYGRGPVLRKSWPLLAIGSVLMGGGQILVTLWDPALAAFLPSFVALLALYPLSRWKRFARPFEGLGPSPIMRRRQPQEGAAAPAMGLGMALFPYLVLTLVAVLVSAYPPLHAFFKGLQFGFSFPSVGTGFGLVTAGAAPYSPFSPFAHPGAYLLVTSGLSYAVYRRCGYYAAEHGREGLFRSLTREAVPTSVAVISFLVTSCVMSHSGQTEVLALGISQVASPPVYAFTSGWLGVLGAFMTSSTTASNALFGALQMRVAHLEGLPVSTVLAAHCTGSAIGNAIAPADVVLGTATAGNAGDEGEVLRKTIPWTLVMGLLCGAGSLLLAALRPAL
ncbi:L-lactate permease [bacterium]|nr:L-lactate permease [bacterium]